MRVFITLLSLTAVLGDLIDQYPIEGGSWEKTVPCVNTVSKVPKCAPTGDCLRHIQDDFISEEEAEVLLAMVERGMLASPENGGPTILDVNSGYMKDGDGLINIYHNHRDHLPVKFSLKEYEVYRNLFDRIRNTIIELNGLDQLWFTFPTFVARLVGNPEWRPQEMHDEYWHPHVDKDNTDHYDYSGLLYLSTYGDDFDGGEFMFMDGASKNKFTNTTVLPRKGRFITFSSDKENLHRVMPVKTGKRYTLSMWFSCDETKHFSTFLDGKAHAALKTQPKEEL